MWNKCSHGWDNFQKFFFTQTPDTLVGMVLIMVNKHVYTPSLKGIMDKYYEMFRGKNQGNNTDLINRTEDSDTDPEPKLPDPPRSWGT